MEYIIIGFILLFFMLRLLPPKGIKQITTAELKNMLKDKDKFFIDVRTPAEFSRNHIASFKNIPLHQLPTKANSLPKDKEIVIICQSGMRSLQGAKILKKAGFEKITNVRGGMNAWR